MTKTFYIVDRRVWEANHHHMLHESHWIETAEPNKLLVVCRFSNEANQDAWEALVGVETLPHPVFAADETIHPKHAEALGHIGVVQTDNVRGLIKKAGARHPMMRLERI